MRIRIPKILKHSKSPPSPAGNYLVGRGRLFYFNSKEESALCTKCKNSRIEFMKRHEISEKQWNRIKSQFPPERKPQGGRPGKSNREMLNAIPYWLNTGVPWRDLPERFGPWQSVYSRFRTWTKAGVWEQVRSALIEQELVDETTLMLDSTTVKVH